MATTTEINVPLVAAEQQELDRLEQVVERGLDTFMEVGTALAAIKTAKLYRQTHASFERYLDDRFGRRLSRRRAYQLIDAAEVCTAVHKLGAPVPASERQARELVGLPTEQAVAVMTTATASGTVTAATIRAARRPIEPSPDQPQGERPAAEEFFTSETEMNDCVAMSTLDEDAFDAALALARDDGDLSREHVADVARAVGAGRRRRALPDAYRDAVRETTKAVERLSRLHADDRFLHHREALSQGHRGDLDRQLGGLRGVVDQLEKAAARARA